MSHNENITRIKAVHNALGDLKNKVVFVGGATVSLYADRQATEVRPTDDVDILVEITSSSEFANLEQQLRERNFKNDTTAKFAGRYTLPGIVVDVMPTDEKILGFVNKWYKEGFQSAINYTIDEQHEVRIFTSPIFIATKLEAFKSRGNNDGRTSSDFEDIVFVLENRSVIWQEMAETSGELAMYLDQEVSALLNNKYCAEWINANSNAYPPSSYFIMSEMKLFLKR